MSPTCCTKSSQLWAASCAYSQIQRLVYSRVLELVTAVTVASTLDPALKSVFIVEKLEANFTLQSDVSQVPACNVLVIVDLNSIDICLV